MEPRNTLFPTLKQIIKPRFSEPSFAQQSPRSSDESLSPTGSGLGRGGSATQSQSTAIVAESATTAPPPPPPSGTTATTTQSIPPKVSLSRTLSRTRPTRSSSIGAADLRHNNNHLNNKPVEFQVLPIAPASFANRRRSIASSTNTDDDLISLGVPMRRTNSGTIGSRKSLASMEGGRLSAQQLLDDDVGGRGIYGWDEEEAELANREYVQFMKTKGVVVGRVKSVANFAASA